MNEAKNAKTKQNVAKMSYFEKNIIAKTIGVEAVFFRERDWSEILRKKVKKIAFLRANEMRKNAETFAKNAKFSRNGFSFSLQTLLGF